MSATRRQAYKATICALARLWFRWGILLLAHFNWRLCLLGTSEQGVRGALPREKAAMVLESGLTRRFSDGTLADGPEQARQSRAASAPSEESPNSTERDAG